MTKQSRESPDRTFSAIQRGVVPEDVVVVEGKTPVGRGVTLDARKREDRVVQRA